jgi:hypothetical protein
MGKIRKHLDMTGRFVTSDFAVAGNPLYSPSAGRWFDSLDTSKMGIVWWQEVLDDVVQKMDSCCAGNPASPVDTHVEIFNIPHCKVTCLIWSDKKFSFLLVTVLRKSGCFICC